MKKTIPVFLYSFAVSFLWFAFIFHSNNTFAEAQTVSSDICQATFNIQFFQEIPDRYSDSFILYSPSQNEISFKPTIFIKGKNKYLTPVYINGKSVEVFNDGKFVSKLDLDQKGGFSFVISFTNLAHQAVHVVRHVFWFDAPPKDITQYEDNKQFISLFLNSPFISTSHPVEALSDSFTRADLAYFIFKLNQAKISYVAHSVFPDVNVGDWYAPYIQYVINENIMNEYPDGKFYPNKPVKKIEYIMSIIKAKKLSASSQTIDLPYKDVNPQHWISKYIGIAYGYHLITPNESFNQDQTLSFGDFIMLAAQIGDVRAFIDQMGSTANYIISDLVKRQIIVSVQDQLAVYSQQMRKEPMIDLITPDVLYCQSNDVQLQGKVSPAGIFSVNGVQYQSHADGSFSIRVPVTPSINQIELRHLNVIKVVSVRYLVSFDDMKGHWIEQAALKCKLLNLLDNDQYFYPRKMITRDEFCHFLVRFFDLKMDSSAIVSFVDVPTDNIYAKDIQIVVSQKILSRGRHTHHFFPDESISRIEALVGILRACELTGTLVSDQIRIPFRNVKPSHWAYPYLQKAYRNGLIQKANFFHLRQSISKAELLSILIKSPSIKAKLFSALQ